MKNQMKTKLLGLASIVLMVGTAVSSASTVSFEYTDPAEGNLVAYFTLNVTGGLATSGTGTITSTLFSGTDTLRLLTSSSTLPPGGGSINPTGVPGPSGFTWHTVPGSSGPDFLSDAVVNNSAPFFDNYGLSFLISNTGNPIVGGINIYANTGSPSSSYTGNLSVSGGCYECYGFGNATLTPVPLPAALPLLLSGVAALGAMGRRRKLAKLAPA